MFSVLKFCLISAWSYKQHSIFYKIMQYDIHSAGGRFWRFAHQFPVDESTIAETQTNRSSRVIIFSNLFTFEFNFMGHLS